MANRFIDTSFYKSPFVRGLKGSLKGLYSFIICDCNGAGIWTADFEVASLYIGFEISRNDFEVFINSGKAIDLNDGRFFFPDFIEHQYPKGLSDTNPAHNNIILELKKFNLIDENLKPLESPFQGTKVMDKVIDKEKVMDKVKVIQEENPKIEKSVYEKTIDNFIEMRKKQRKPPTGEAMRLIRIDLEELSGGDETVKVEILNKSIKNNWTGVFALKEKQGRVSPKFADQLEKKNYSNQTIFQPLQK